MNVETKSIVTKRELSNRIEKLQNHPHALDLLLIIDHKENSHHNNNKNKNQIE